MPATQDEAGRRQEYVETRPIPDPTALTTAQLMREVAALKEIVFTRLEGMDRAVLLFKDDITRVPTDTDKQIQHLKELLLSMMDERQTSLSTQLQAQDDRLDKSIRQENDLINEKFASVQIQFKERDTRVEQTAKDTKVAVDAALQAAEKAVSKQNEAFSASIVKSESATTKQIDAQGLLISTSTSGLNSKIDDIKERLTGIESEGRGKTSTWLVLIGSASLFAALIGIGSFVFNRTPAPVVPALAPQIIYTPAAPIPVPPITK